MVLPTLPQGPNPSWDIGSVARTAESAGADALWACDHLAWQTPTLECFTALAMAVASTRECAVGTGVLQLPLRPAPLVAKTAASLSVASGGRFVLGVGVGLHEGEFAAMDAEFHARGKRTEEAIHALRRLWEDGLSQPDEVFGGRYRQAPAPGAVPVWIGGSGDVARRRAVRIGDGWMPLFVPPDDLRGRIVRLREECEAAGRASDAVVTSLVLFVSAGTGPDERRAEERGLAWMSSLYALPGHKFAKYLVSGPPAACAEVVARYFDAGVNHVVLFITDDQPLDQFGAIAGELAVSR